ncbi:formyl-coenzyme A transferase [Verticillium dahliae VdLs.17]|uniref:Formyl-coenzyme A transferase n=1 Tax=Verticillium dahliae (strain VdLs.17 / ATCC MYA-4575 / FGSC 10137) TaxID=498257 RepID=G2XDB8_VERDV|nr:formyl-coenzyme A transferase [Verticillium dahliae VdLs.17]EGY16986.1 formyl-coenzyme A transferase [Verticillium dahliae VdLs.17]
MFRMNLGIRSAQASRACLRTLGTTRSHATATAPAKLPLDGVKVLDLSRVLAGPYCTQILGDMGADILKVEHPVRGDDTRSWGPPYAPRLDGADSAIPAGESAYYLSKVDVVVENYLPGSLKKYGLDYETLRKLNPKLIYASITGYGQFGPYSDRAGYDVMVEAEMGLMHITGSRDGPPVKVGQCSSRRREIAGVGEQLIVTSVVPYRAFKSSDGDILFGGGNDRLFAILAKGLGRPEWAADDRFATNSARVKHRDVLEKWIEDVTSTKTTQEWLDIFDGTGLPYAKVNDLMDTTQHRHVKYSRSQPTIRSAPPLLGQHTDEVLREELGLNDADIAFLRQGGVVR